MNVDKRLRRFLFLAVPWRIFPRAIPFSKRHFDGAGPCGALAVACAACPVVGAEFLVHLRVRAEVGVVLGRGDFGLCVPAAERGVWQGRIAHGTRNTVYELKCGGVLRRIDARRGFHDSYALLQNVEEKLFMRSTRLGVFLVTLETADLSLERARFCAHRDLADAWRCEGSCEDAAAGRAAAWEYWTWLPGL